MQNQPCLIVLNGEIPTSQLIYELWKDAGLKICADGAIDRLEEINFSHGPDLIIGDGDSISDDSKFKYRNAFIGDDKQTQSDSEKCILYALGKKVSTIDIVGADGIRTDHFLYNLFLLRKFSSKVIMHIWNDHEVIMYKNESFTLEAEIGRRISLFPLFENARIGNISGLKYDIKDEVLSGDSRVSISNEINSSPISVELLEGGLFIFLEYQEPKNKRARKSIKN